MQQEQIAKMRTCSHLLPDPGGEVVRECLDEIERLRSFLEYISSPIVGMRKEAEAEGCVLNAGMALEIANDPEHLRSTAKNALGV
jgi:hypothetical protein